MMPVDRASIEAASAPSCGRSHEFIGTTPQCQRCGLAVASWDEAAMKLRDPKRDPRPGDVVCVGFDCRTVLAITQGGAIRYLGDRYEGLCPLTMWRVWCHGPAVLRSAA